LNLTSAEKDAIKEFLLSLSGEEVRFDMPKGGKIEYQPLPNWREVKN